MQERLEETLVYGRCNTKISDSAVIIFAIYKDAKYLDSSRIDRIDIGQFLNKLSEFWTPSGSNDIGQHGGREEAE
jgi:hypothetical protein